jgi:glycosyltransferase involved in cell wall biosynthesis
MKFSLIEIIITFFLINYINCQIDTTKENEIKAFISLNKEEKLTTGKKFEISENPKISIIIPIYNNEQSITSTIRSIQNQNLLDIEIVCINDHSNDTSLKILKNLQKNDPRIGVIRNKSNRGILYNLIDGAMQSSGEYVLFMYPGDYLSRSDALLKLYDIATKDYAKKLEIVNFQACDFEIINGEIHIKNLISEIDKSNLTTMIRQPDIENYYYNNFKNRKHEVIFDKMYRKAVIKRMEKFIGPNIYNLNINFFHEYILNFANIVKAKSLAYIEDIFYCHLINNKINNEWEIIDDKLKTPQITNKNFIDYILITERIFDLTSQEVKSIQLRENILKKIGDEQILNALARSLYFDRYISLYEQLIKWKLIDKETKKRNKQIVKYVMVFELDPEKKFGYITEEEDDDEEDDFNGYDYL